jgi:hypothetical protein
MAKKSRSRSRSKSKSNSKSKTFTFQRNKKHLDSKSKLQLGYNNTNIKDTDIKMDSYANALSINYNTTSQLKLSYPKPSNVYNATKIRVYRVLHNNIKDVTCDKNGNSIASRNNIIGELVVENTSASGNNKIYVCFLLKKGSTNKNEDIDNVINNLYLDSSYHKPSIKFNMNNYISNSSAYVYASNNDKVIVFTTPLVLNSSQNRISDYSTTTSLFKIIPTDNKKSYTEINYVSGMSGSRSSNGVGSADANGIYIDCKPTGVSDSKIAAYNVPINSEYTKNAAKIDFMKMTIQLTFVCIMMLVIYFVVPFFYKAAVIDSVNKFVKETDEDYNIIGLPKYIEKIDKARFVRIRTADTMILIYCFIIFSILLIEGFKGNNFDLIMWALYFSIMFGLGFSTVQFSKTNREFMKTKIKDGNSFKYEGKLYPDEPVNTEAPNYLFFSDFGKFFPQIFRFIMNEYKQYNLIIMLFLALLTLFILVICKWAKSIKSWKMVNSIFWYVIFFIIIPGVPTFLLSLIDSNNELQNFT